MIFHRPPTSARNPHGKRHLRANVVLTGLAVLACTALLGACGGEPSSAPALNAPASPAASATVVPGATSSTASIRGNRYCEVLLAFVKGSGIKAEVWGTQGLNDCPSAQWRSVDKDAVRARFGASAAVLNGPRYWVIDEADASLPDRAARSFGTLRMRQLATVTLKAGEAQSQPYVERTVNRDSRFTFRAGAQIYELIAPGGATYVMQSYAQIVDSSLTEAGLNILGARMRLPAGWTYRTRVLAAPLTVRTPGRATVIQDDLQNSYSRYSQGG
jgi:hypothetical protein